jgi:hypothetical protein
LIFTKCLEELTVQTPGIFLSALFLFLKSILKVCVILNLSTSVNCLIDWRSLFYYLFYFFKLIAMPSTFFIPNFNNFCFLSSFFSV